jgi:TonB family protein
MDRLQKKCFMASCGMHGMLLLVVMFGAAFFTQEKKTPPVGTLTMVPSRLIDGALSGGGGNPNIPRTEDRIKGNTLAPVPQQPQQTKTEPPKPKQEVAKVDPPKPAPTKTTIPKDPPKATSKPKETIQLTPVNRSAQRNKAKEAEAKRRAEAKAAQDKLAKAIGKVREEMKQGFTSGTAVEVSGPGGEAYASYRSFVFAAYDNEWQVQNDVADDDASVVARVVVHRTGRIISAEISERSGLPALDKSVRRALDAVRSLPPFPEGARDQERTFGIEFSLKAKRLLG